jgi:hypothetical protein
MEVILMDIFEITTTEELAEFGKRMSQVMIKLKKAFEHSWEVLASYGVTLEKLEEVSAAVADGTMTRREGWTYLGLPEDDYPGGDIDEIPKRYI